MVLKEWVESITNLAIIVMCYAMLVPFENMLVNITVNMGAPAGNAFFLMKMLQFGLIIMAVGCILYPFAASYKRTYDQGQYQQQDSNLWR